MEARLICAWNNKKNNKFPVTITLFCQQRFLFELNFNIILCAFTRDLVNQSDNVFSSVELFGSLRKLTFPKSIWPINLNYFSIKQFQAFASTLIFTLMLMNHFGIPWTNADGLEQLPGCLICIKPYQAINDFHVLWEL